MKTAVQPVSKECSALDSAITVTPGGSPPINLCDDKGDPISVKTGETLQWSWEYNFSVTITGVFGSISITAVQLSDNCYLTPTLIVTGSAGTAAYCQYKQLGDLGDNPQPAPPPNVIIVDNSGGTKEQREKASMSFGVTEKKTISFYERSYHEKRTSNRTPGIEQEGY